MKAGPLIHRIEISPQEFPKVCEVSDESGWSLAEIIGLLTPQLVAEILNSSVVLTEQSDRRVWKHTNSGSLSVKTAWNLVRRMGEVNEIVESDSLILVQMVLGKVEVPWRLKAVVEKVNHLFGRLCVQINYIYREANGLADYLASLAVRLGGSVDFSGNGVLPSVGRLLLHWDQAQLPVVRMNRVIIRGSLPL